MTRPACLQPVAPESPMHRRQCVGSRMTAGCRARLERSRGSRLCVRVMTAAALRAVRLVFRRELPKPLAHLMATETLLVTRHERCARRIDRIPLRRLYRELMTHGAVQVGLLGHATQLHFHVIVTA